MHAPELVPRIFARLGSPSVKRHVSGAEVKLSGVEAMHTLNVDVSGPRIGRWRRWAAADKLAGGTIVGLARRMLFDDDRDEANAWVEEQLATCTQPPQEVQVELQHAASLLDEGDTRVSDRLQCVSQITLQCPASLYLRQHRGLAQAPTALIEHNEALQFIARDIYPYQLPVGYPTRWLHAPVLAVLGTNEQGGVTCMQRIYLTELGYRMMLLDDTTGQPVKAKKCNLGAGVQPGYLRRGTARWAALAEGPETALSLYAIDATTHLFCSFGKGNLATFDQRRRLPHVDSVYLCADRDADLEPFYEAAAKLRTRGYTVLVCVPPEPHKDWNDVLVALGPQGLHGAFWAAVDAAKRH